MGKIHVQLPLTEIRSEDSHPLPKDRVGRDIDLQAPCPLGILVQAPIGRRSPWDIARREHLITKIFPVQAMPVNIDMNMLFQPGPNKWTIVTVRIKIPREASRSYSKNDIRDLKLSFHLNLLIMVRGMTTKPPHIKRRWP
jgi:hypothetical protein